MNGHRKLTDAEIASVTGGAGLSIASAGDDIPRCGNEPRPHPWAVQLQVQQSSVMKIVGF